MRPLLKSFLQRREGEKLLLVRDVGEGFEFDDPDGQIEALIKLLDGTRGPAEICAELSSRWPELTAENIWDGVLQLDAAGLVEDVEAAVELPESDLTRYVSGLDFFGTFATLDQSRYAFQRRLRDSHVVLLGVGGLGSSVLLGLAGSGVGRITLVDTDRVELKNLTRQFLYSESDIGQPKVRRAADRARAANSSIRVDAVDRRIRGAGDVAPLLTDADLVICGIDQPMASRYWVNEACVAAGVPWIGGGMTVTRLVYWSVWPGHSGCFGCRDASGPGPSAGLVSDDDLRRWRTNRTIGPMASIVAGYVGLEALRYLTGFAPPAAAGRSWSIDLVSGRTDLESAWDQRSDCAVCVAAGLVSSSGGAR